MGRCNVPFTVHIHSWQRLIPISCGFTILRSKYNLCALEVLCQKLSGHKLPEWQTILILMTLWPLHYCYYLDKLCLQYSESLKNIKIISTGCEFSKQHFSIVSCTFMLTLQPSVDKAIIICKLIAGTIISQGYHNLSFTCLKKLIINCIYCVLWKMSTFSACLRNINCCNNTAWNGYLAVDLTNKSVSFMFNEKSGLMQHEEIHLNCFCFSLKVMKAFISVHKWFSAILKVRTSYVLITSLYLFTTSLSGGLKCLIWFE